jgi:hypothetical protein
MLWHPLRADGVLMIERINHLIRARCELDKSRIRLLGRSPN